MVHVRNDDDNWVGNKKIMSGHFYYTTIVSSCSYQVGGHCDDTIDKDRQLSREGYSLI